MIRVCDAIMGTGKSEAAIAYMNAHPDERFIYITPYLEEASRIVTSCPELHFVEPSKNNPKFHFSKSIHSLNLIENGRNIATTHQAFKFYTCDILATIKENHYTAIIDENVDVLEQCEIDCGDVELLERGGFIREVDGVYSRTAIPYNGKSFQPIFRLLDSRLLTKTDDTVQKKIYFWNLPAELILSFKNVFILTYLFEGQSLYHLLQMNDIPYEYIGVERSEGKFRFVDGPSDWPDYVSRLPELIHIFQNEKCNAIGDRTHALSKSWFSNHPEKVQCLQKHLYNYFNNYCKETKSEDRMWGTFKCGMAKIRGKGYSKGYLVFNCKATNAYRYKTDLAYCCNLFLNVGEKLYYQQNGITPNEDLYALSTMLQWIWRSAIRDGKPIRIYVPSRRMRHLLINWIDVVSRQANGEALDLTAISYTPPKIKIEEERPVVERQISRTHIFRPKRRKTTT